ncbi:uncharacterized protein PFLUO_LOCUS9423 [Penicillium psychrofluorescens]|uniref:uncharacterized protein n=1 Tax=Penicillium psychrofluorescens TaxID=3158075 RepID=UPI003CCD0BD3
MTSTATTSSAQPTSHDPSFPIERISTSQPSAPGWRPPQHTHRRNSLSPTPSETSSAAEDEDTVHASNYPTGNMSLSGISLRAFLLGVTLGLSACSTLFLVAVYPTPLWRAPFFISALSLFHFLEFFVTAKYNTRYATVSAFLLSSNGWAYNAAHGSALVECLLSQLFWPNTSIIPGVLSTTALALGFILMLVGQVTRTLAMAQAASNFNHHIQVEHKEGHVLVTQGLYRLLRHPSYFGFFWWGLGTQLVLGNAVCLVGYAVVLWRFFSIRIQREENFLVQFFGEEYIRYRKTTPVGIPGIR